MRWYWVQLYFRGDGYYDDTYWELRCARDEQHIRDSQHVNSMHDILEIIPFEDAPIPAKPRVTKYARPFNPKLKQP